MREGLSNKKFAYNLKPNQTKFMHIQSHTQTHAHTHIYVCIYIYINMHLYLIIYIYMYINVCMYIYVYIYILYINMYTYEHVRLCQPTAVPIYKAPFCGMWPPTAAGKSLSYDLKLYNWFPWRRMYCCYNPLASDHANAISQFTVVHIVIAHVCIDKSM